MIPRVLAGQNGWHTGGGEAKDGTQFFTMRQFSLKKFSVSQHFPAERVYKYD